MPTIPSATTIRAWARLMKAQRIALSTIEGALKAAKLPQLAWYDALLELERAGEKGLRPRELEREMLMAQYNLSRLVDRMEAKKYVAQIACEEDGRGQVLVITPAGKAIRRRMWSVYSSAIEEAVGERLPEKKIAQLDDLLAELIANGAARDS